MDTITHLALGSVTGELIGRRKLGKGALVAGAVANVFPDIDVTAALWLNPADNVLFHRGITHSIFTSLIFAIALSWLIARYRKTPDEWPFWMRFLLIQFFLHLFVDSFNAYGSGLLEPFFTEKFSLHSLYVVDPFFSIWLFVATVLLFVLREEKARRRIAFAALAVCSIYMTSAIIGRRIVMHGVRDVLAERELKYQRLLVTPTPLNSWLWFVAAETPEGYYLNYVSVFHPDRVAEFHFVDKGTPLVSKVRDTETFNKLSGFSDGFYTLSRKNGEVVFNNLYFGQIAGWKDPTADFAFHYYLDGGGDNKYVMQRGRFSSWNKETVDVLFRRTFHGN
jgi:inner membrane protein